ncbi:MAG: nucleotidyltransferase domain-containing protein [Lachnospiraceae bacterium]|nr:nucleotidyltransferase domain-containing protein [Lachnospiraceae bacterium]
MATEDKIYTINQIKMRISPILKEYGVKSATLFGSYSQGCATERSDIDLLVDSGLRGLRFVGLIEDLRIAVEKAVDVLDISHIQEGTEIEDEIKRTGVMIYER